MPKLGMEAIAIFENPIHVLKAVPLIFQNPPG